MSYTHLNPLATVKRVSPYAQIASFYDRLMDHVDYKGWIDYLETIFHKFGGDIERIVDAGCGTGNVLQELILRKYKVAGFDYSLGMIEQAKRKGLTTVWQGDLRHLALNGKWDAMICLYDTIHYLSLEEIRNLFKAIQLILVKNGLFIFDMITEHHVLQCWADYTEMDHTDDGEYIRRSWYDRRLKCQHTDFEIVNDVDDQIYLEEHLQWIYPLNQIGNLAEKSGFCVLGIFDGCSFESGNEYSDRIHFVLGGRQV